MFGNILKYAASTWVISVSKLPPSARRSLPQLEWTPQFQLLADYSDVLLAPHRPFIRPVRFAAARMFERRVSAWQQAVGASRGEQIPVGG